jgi:hypothetical protein
MSKTVLEVDRRELRGVRLRVRVVQDGEMFRFDPADFSGDADASLTDLLGRSGTLLHVGTHNCLHVRTESASARDAVLGSLRVVDGLEAMDPTAWPASDEHAAEHAEEDEDEEWADDPEVLTRWLVLDNDTVVVRLAAGQPVLVIAGWGLCVPEPFISAFQASEGVSMTSGSSQLDLGSLPDGQLISVGSGDEPPLEVLNTGQSQSDTVADWLRDNILDTRFALQAFDTDLDDQDVDLLMEASTAFGVQTTQFGLHMRSDQIAAIVNRLCEMDKSLAALRTAVEEAQSEPGLRLRAVLRRSRDNDVYEDLKEWFPLL